MIKIRINCHYLIIKWICRSIDSSGLTLCSTTCLFCVVILPPFLINLFYVNLVYWHSYSVRCANKLTMPKLNPPENVSLTRPIDRMTRMETQIYSIQDSNEVHGWGREHLDKLFNLRHGTRGRRYLGEKPQL